MPGKRTTLLAALALGLVAASGAQVLSAQAPARDGIFVGFGLGWGSFGVEDATEREAGLSGYFKIGYALSDKVLLGFESNGWVKDVRGRTITAGHLGAVAYVYPAAGGGFFLKGGLGRAAVAVDAGVPRGVSESGFGLIVGAGYDVGFGGRLGLTPYGNFMYGSFDGGSTSILQFGLGVDWY